MSTTTRTIQIQILTFSTMPALALEGWNPNTCSGADYQTPRAAALYSALDVKASDEEYALAAADDGRWALIGLTTSGHRYAAEVDVEIESVQLTPADTAEIERKALAAAAEPDAKLTELRARMAARGDVTPYAEIQEATRATRVVPGTFLVLGAGASSVPEIRVADNDDDNWTLARVLFERQLRETAQTSDRWCVLVTGVAESDLDADHATIAYRAILDFDLALGACRGVNVREQGEIEDVKAAMAAAGAI